MSQTFKIRKGHDIKLVGGAPKTDLGRITASTYAVTPSDFPGITPKLVVKAGTQVKAGDTLFFDKDRPEVKICSPVSGEVAEVKRGAKRKILAVLILADTECSYADHGAFSFSGATRDAAAAHFASTGVGALITSRPYGVAAGMSEKPRAIFINGIQSGPLAGDLAYQLEGKEKSIATAVKALKLMTEGTVYVSHDSDKAPIEALQSLDATHITFSGKHPKGLVGTQIAQTAPLNKGEIVWTVNAIDLPTIGAAFESGEYRPEYRIALAGSKTMNAGYATALQGVS
ncbi:NADH:ubiquinone reductase (Na(+)-transporting) subunit A, partial [Schleiferiaceae bacterium]|nr:NADH:ubiquinone reductase (Na(+)-transporting) subunit A [Schleiferiaceae bacterium]